MVAEDVGDRAGAPVADADAGVADAVAGVIDADADAGVGEAEAEPPADAATLALGVRDGLRVKLAAALGSICANSKSGRR